MKTRFILIVCLVALVAACSQKQSAVSVPVSHINVESLLDSIDYDMDVSALPLSDISLLRNAPAARKGFPIKDAYLRGIYETTTWYDSLMWKFDSSTDFNAIKMREDEPWRDYYYRAAIETEAIKFSDEEKAFIDRMEAREAELLKANFAAGEGIRVNMQNLSNPTQLKEFDSLLCQHLAKDGFAIVPANHEQLFHIYEQNDYDQFPNFVTTDLYLQLYHLYVDCLLRELESDRLLDLMTSFSLDMYQAMNRLESLSEGDELVERLAHHNAVFFDVAHILFTGKAIGSPLQDQEANQLVGLATDAVNSPCPFFEDYVEIAFPFSLFRPRGHYTRSEKLQRYFRGMMWLQTAPFGMDNKEEILQAVMIASAMKYEAAAMKKYETLDLLITLLMGKSDNLSLPQVIAEVKKENLPMNELLHNDQAIQRITLALEKIGNEQTRIRPKFEKTSHNKICIMPQRYQPDAEVLQEMVDYDGDPTQRAVPKGLDFFAAMGVSAAEQILMEEKTEWGGFDAAMKQMKKRMGEIDWSETTCTQWMQTLKVLTDKEGKEKMPYFMVTPEWDKKDLNAVLASWAELKHDAILYAKQPMGAECGGGEEIPEPVVKGYVEPNTGFWKKAIELLDNTAKVLKAQGMLTEKVSSVTERMREEAQFLLAISEKELAGKEPTDEEYDQLKVIGATFENISLDLVRGEEQYLMGWADVQGADRKVALVADVYTANADNNPNKSILFEGVGNADEIYVVVEVGGYLMLTRGAVLSYREFIQPIDEPRLTDEEWQQQLEKNARKGVPEWMKPLFVPLNKLPEANEEFFYSSGC